MVRWQRILPGASSFVLSPFVKVEIPGVCERRNGGLADKGRAPRQTLAGRNSADSGLVSAGGRCLEVATVAEGSQGLSSLTR